MGKCLLVAGGAVSALLLKKIFREGDFAYVFAVDRGLEALDACEIRPTHLVGDFDSVAPEVLGKYLTESLELERLVPEKDDTDTEHAMRQAVALGAEEIVLTGGFGTRFDHVLANVHTLTIPLLAGIPACMVDETNRVRLLAGASRSGTNFLLSGENVSCAGYEAVSSAGRDARNGSEKGSSAAQTCGTLHQEGHAKGTDMLRIKKRDAWGTYVSLLPLTTEVTGITLDGFKYPLANATFKIGETVSLGVSNELTAEEGIIRLKTGILALIESKDS